MPQPAQTPRPDTPQTMVNRSETASPIGKKPRNRSTLVCTNCKRLKTKCDKKLPCMKCIMTKKADSCSYMSLNSPSSENVGTFNVLRQSNEVYLQTPATTTNSSSNSFTNKDISPRLEQARDNVDQYKPYSALNLTIYTPEENISTNIPSKQGDVENLQSLVHQFSQSISDINRESVLEEMVKLTETIKNKGRFNKKENLILDSKLWNSPNLPSQFPEFGFNQTTANPLIYPSNLWGDKDFVYLAKELFEPMLKLYFNKWISVKKIDSIRTDLTYNANQSEIDEVMSKIKPYLIDNYNGILERILYFRNEVVPIVFSEYIPTDLIDAIMKEFLDFDKLLYYNQISDTIFESCFVLSMVDIACIFKNLNPNENRFRYNLVCLFPSARESANLNDLVILLLNYQLTKERPNFLAFFIRVMVTFRTYNFSNDSFSGISEELMYPAFKEEIGVLFQLNFHLPCKINLSFNSMRYEKFKNYKIDQLAIWRIWNRFQSVDAMYSVKLKNPLLINYDYCEEHHIFDNNNILEKINHDFVLLNRKFAYLLNSKYGTAYRSFVQIAIDVLNIARELGRFRNVKLLNNNFHLIQKSEKLWFDLKFISLKGAFFCNILLSERLKKSKIIESFPDYNFQCEEFKEVRQIRGLAKLRAYICYISILRIIEAVSIPNLLNPALLFCIKKDLLTWFGFASLCLLDCISNNQDDQVCDDESKKIDILSYNLNDLEELVFDEAKLIDIYENKRVDFGEYRKLSNLLMQIYNITKSNPIIASSFDYYVKSKVLTLVSYILIAFEDVKSTQGNLSNANLYSVISTLVKERMNSFQNSKDDIKRDSLLRLVVNYDDSETNNQYSQPRDATGNTPVMEGSDYNINNDPSMLSTAETMLSQSQFMSPENADLLRLPPEELIGMIRLFINDDRFTTRITQLDTNDRSM